MRTLVTALLFLVVSSANAAEKPPIDGWCYPAESDYIDDWEDSRKQLRVPFHVQADFNGDGLVDDAWILIRTKGKGWGLFVFMGQQSNSKKIIQLDDNLNNDYP